LTPSLEPGSLDITNFSVALDDKNIYFSLRFRNLSNPGWHPEYGFQLTYGAIAVDKDGKQSSGQVLVGRNAKFVLNKMDAFENIIYFGGGISLENASGDILAEYRPVSGDEKNPLGSVETKTVSFAIPLEILGKPSPRWKYTVLVGAQDDHGGAGIGEFRNVAANASEWVGGGKKKPDDPNVYDVILPKK
jgi:carbohydrate-binding DOMON domain-containing protein